MRELSIDIETYSSVDIKKAGLYKYVQSPDFEILLFAYAYDDGPVNIIDLACGEKIPYFTLMDLHRADVVKTAHNAAFEYYCLSKFFETHISQWRCTMVHSLYCGYPASLDAVGKAMNFSQDRRKMSEGKALIKYFCVPCAPTQRNGGRTRNLPKHDPGKWNLFKEYCKQDVFTEREIKKELDVYPVPESEQHLWELDQAINIGGVALDMELIQGALTISGHMSSELKKKAQDITGLDNPNSVSQLKEWIEQNADMEIESLNKQTVSEMLADKDGKEQVREVLKIRQEMAKTSIKKYEAMEKAVCDDGRVRGLLQFYGANRTGRWAGRLVQVQNLPRNYLESLGTARELVRKRKIDTLKILYGNVPDTLSQLIRTAFVPAAGHEFAVADFSAIEARVIAWLAGEEWRLDVFRTHGKIYEASASTMFGVDIDLIRKGNPEYALRAKGKVAELALGYQGASGALIQMGALNMGLKEEELPDIVKRWRASNRRIVDLWYSVEQAAVECVKTGMPRTLPCNVSFARDSRFLMVMLPSGRKLFYSSPRLIPNDRGYDSLWFMGMNQTSKKWENIQTYGGKLTENIVQAVARDCLANAMMNLQYAGYKINFHIHDEVILEIPRDGIQSLDEAIRLMCINPPWATGLPLNADGFTGDYYKKE
ncbi:DNA polymerase [Faecalicatena contorta]|uniref:DNA polymerase n=1 Tax=Faecalicatena contorta TaxID=39482 RepID=UPI003217F915